MSWFLSITEPGALLENQLVSDSLAGKHILNSGLNSVERARTAHLLEATLPTNDPQLNLELLKLATRKSGSDGRTYGRLLGSPDERKRSIAFEINLETDTQHILGFEYTDENGTKQLEGDDGGGLDACLNDFEAVAEASKHLGEGYLAVMARVQKQTRAAKNNTPPKKSNLPSIKPSLFERPGPNKAKFGLTKTKNYRTLILDCLDVIDSKEFNPIDNCDIKDSDYLLIVREYDDHNPDTFFREECERFINPTWKS